MLTRPQKNVKGQGQAQQSQG